MSLIIFSYGQKGSADNTLSLSLHPKDPAIIDISSPASGLEANPKLFVYESKDIFDDGDYALFEMIAKLFIGLQALSKQLTRLSDRFSDNPTDDNTVDPEHRQDPSGTTALSPDVSDEDEHNTDDEGFCIWEALNITPLLRKTKNDNIVPITANAGIKTVKKAIPFTLSRKEEASLQTLLDVEQGTEHTHPIEDHQVVNQKVNEYVVIAISTNLKGEVCIALFDKIPDSLSGNPFSHLQSRFRQFE